MKGIERGRHFCQNDAHLFVTPEQIESEFSKVVDLIFNTYKDFGITDYRCVLSLRDPEEGSAGFKTEVMGDLTDTDRQILVGVLCVSVDHHVVRATVWQELENYIKDKERRLGYLHVMTPCVGTVNLYKTSGHWDHYKENMFPPMEVEGESFVLRPMNCPHHMMIYEHTKHSYKDLPIRIGEIAHDFRFEASGTLKGIERGRHFCQNDAHLFVTPEQILQAGRNPADR